MEMCEVCGRHEAIAVNLIEGAKLNVCRSCSFHGRPVSRIRTDDVGKQTVVSTQIPQEIEEVIEGWGKAIKNARERKGLSLKELGHKINETEGGLDHIEKEKFKPDFKVARKLEKELGIHLVVKTKEVGSSAGMATEKFREPTLLDMLQSQLKKKK